MNLILNKNNKYRVFYILCLLFLNFNSFALTKVAIELKWFHQFQFAGIYAAKELGYYKQAGLDVKIIERNIKSTPLKDVLSNKVQFGISDSTIILNRLQGYKVVMLGAIYQHSPLVLLSLAKKGLLSPLELKNKKLMYQTNVDDALIIGMFNELGMSKKDFIAIPHNFNDKALLDSSIDAMSAYLGDQTFFYEQSGINLNIIKPINYGIDLYGDIIFTSEEYFKNNKDTALKFRKASIKGWEYALNHSEEIIDLIIRKYSNKKTKQALFHEAKYTKQMIAAKLIEVGHINSQRLNRIENIYKSWHKDVQQKSIKGLNFEEYLESNENKYQSILFYIILISIFIVSISILFAYNTRKRSRKKQSKAKKKINSYQKIIMQQLITTRTDESGIITFASEAFTKLLGINQKELLGKKKSSLYISNDQEKLNKEIISTIKNQGVWRGELKLKATDNRTIYFDSIVDNISEPNEVNSGFLAIHFDITDKKIAEKNSITDQLTRLPNRHKIDAVLNYEIKRYNRYKTNFCIALIDIDHFKLINDNYGHISGDNVLKSIASILEKHTREIDTVGRWGGEEFLIICPESSINETNLLVDKIRNLIAKYNFYEINEPIHISAGLTAYLENETANSLLSRADKGLYKAKSLGRNQIIIM